jgi:hypothetical protein
LSTGWKLVSFLPSKPVPNSICGTLQEPKSPTLVEVDVLEDAEAELDEVDDETTLDPVLLMMFP